MLLTLARSAGRTALALLLLLTGNAWSQSNYKLNGPITAPPLVVGDVADLRISPDGARAVYLANQDSASAVELYSVLLDGSGTSVKLNGPLAEGRELAYFQISPDGQRVVYRAVQEGRVGYELYSVPIDASADPLRLNEALGPSEYVGVKFLITPDSARVVYQLGLRLFSAALDGSSPPIEISGWFADGYVFEFELAPDGRRVVFTARRRLSEPLALYSALVDPGTSPNGRARRSPPVPRVRLSDGHVSSFRISDDSRMVVYQKGLGYELHGVPIAGGISRMLSGPLVAGGSVRLHGYRISPDGARVVYLADQDTDDTHELYGVPIDASSPPVRLNAPLPPGGDVWNTEFDISRDGQRVVYLAEQVADGVFGYFSVPIDAGASPVQLSAPLLPGETLQTFRISPLGRVVYLIDWGCGEGFDLHSVPLDGSSAPLKINGRHEGECGEEQDEYDNFDFELSPDGRTVVYLTDQDGEEVYELYSAPVDGGVSATRHGRVFPRPRPVKLNAPLPPGGDVGDEYEGTNFAVSPDSALVVYRAEQETSGLLELFVAPIDGSAVSRKLNPRLALGGVPGDVFFAAISPDGQRVVYTANQEDYELVELYSAQIGGGAVPIKLSDPQEPVAGKVEITADGGRVVYMAGEEYFPELYSVPITGGSPPVELNPPLVSGGRIVTFKLSPDGALVAYSADQEVDERFELFLVPSDGSAPAVKLNAPLVAGGDADICTSDVVPHPSFTPDGLRFLYRADQTQDEVFELYSVPVDLSSPPVKLNGPLVAGGDVSYFAACFFVGPDGGRVLYHADQETDQIYELYSVPADGSAAAIKLNGPLAAGGSVAVLVQIAPDGSRAVYVAPQDTPGVQELYVVPLDGSAAPLKLNGQLDSGGDVRPYDDGVQITADGARVVYVADQDTNERFELYSVPIGGGQAVKLNETLAGQRDVDRFLISPDGSRVVYVADQEVDQLFELYSAPSDGSAPAVKLSHVLQPGDNVHSFQIAPGSAHVVYGAYRPLEGFNLFRVSILGNATALQLSGPMAGDGVLFYARRFAISPDGRLVVYIADQDEADVFELYGASASSGPLVADPPAGALTRN